MTQQDQKLPMLEKIGYACGDGASNLIWMMFVYWQLIFYTDVFGLTASALATMLFVTRIWDMFSDVVIGTIADRTRTRWGRFRPYLLWMALPFGIISVATFTTPSFGASGKLIYAYVTLSMMMLVYSGVNVPYSSLMGVISPDSQERTSLSSWRFTFAFLGGLVVQFSTLRLVAFFGKGNQTLGYQLTLAVYAVAAIALFLATFATTRERVQPVVEQNTSRARDIRDLLANTPWLVLCALGILSVCFVSIRGAAIVYYFKYYVGSVAGAATFMVVGSVMSVLGTFLIQYVTPFTGRKNAFIGLMLLAGLSLVPALLSLCGGVLGFLAGACVAWLVRTVAEFPAQITPGIVVSSITVSTLVGLAAGWLPARRASTSSTRAKSAKKAAPASSRDSTVNNLTSSHNSKPPTRAAPSPASTSPISRRPGRSPCTSPRSTPLSPIPCPPPRPPSPAA